MPAEVRPGQRIIQGLTVMPMAGLPRAFLQTKWHSNDAGHEMSNQWIIIIIINIVIIIIIIIIIIIMIIIMKKGTIHVYSL